MKLGVASAVVGGRRVYGDVEIADGAVTGIGVTPPGRKGIATAGFVDLQVNGFGGVDFLDTDEAGYEKAGRALARTGVTAYQPTFITSPESDVLAALDVAAQLPEAPGGPRILGVHLEGPFISPKWPGAHNPDNIIPPGLELAQRLCERGPVTYMTIAPEGDGALDLLDWLRSRGIVVSLGHCDADATIAHAAFDRGARAITHIFNAQRRWSARDPGVAGVALARNDVVVTAIADFVHLGRETVMATWRATQGRFVVVTDAIMAAGLPSGSYTLGDRSVVVEDGAARLPDGTLAGSVATMDGALRNLVSLGIPLEDAVLAMTTVPAGAIERPELGHLEPGSPADVVVLDDSLNVIRTLVDGREAFVS